MELNNILSGHPDRALIPKIHTIHHQSTQQQNYFDDDFKRAEKLGAAARVPKTPRVRG